MSTMMMMMIGKYASIPLDVGFAVEYDGIDDEFDVPVDVFSCDSFRMFEFKVKRCCRARAHDWTECPYAHPGEKARRRDPRRYSYSGSACPHFRRGACPRGDDCEYAHGVFECWLHPSRYRTQLCKDGTHCRRRVCFFAHSPEQLRHRVPDPYLVRVPSSPAYSSPSSPSESASPDLQFTRPFPSQFLFGSPIHNRISTHFTPLEDEVVMERVESGKALREKLYAKLVEENSLNRVS